MFRVRYCPGEDAMALAAKETKMSRTLARITLILGTAALSVVPIQAQSPKDSPSDEYLLLGSPNRGAGEPWVFVNPKDPKNIIVVAMATLNRLPTGEYPIASGKPGAAELRIKELSTPDGSRTDIAVTEDGGQTWTFCEDNLRKYYQKNRC